MTDNAISHPVILFDGVCNLCNHSVQFIIKHDKEGAFRFAALQSSWAEKLLADTTLPDTPDSILLYMDQRLSSRSDAVLKIARTLGGFFWLTQGAYILPRVVRDWLYDFVAQHRYTWFCRRDQCMIPTPDLLNRFYT